MKWKRKTIFFSCLASASPAVVPPGGIHTIQEGDGIKLHAPLQGFDLKTNVRVAFLQEAGPHISLKKERAEQGESDAAPVATGGGVYLLACECTGLVQPAIFTRQV